ncbi:MAG: hypothetical protein JRJ29_01740 [Deltaproteobacteria bacterium]|nr:hypothetical protein [Deltaproteobacteria bacterium]
MRPPGNVSKITPPRLPRIVERPRLMERLERSRDRRLILILGQAAQGKSTLAASFVQADAIPSAWVNLAREDSDPVNLYHSIVHSIQHVMRDVDLSPLLSYPSMIMGPRAEVPLYREWTNAISEFISSPVRIVLDGLDRLSPEAPSSSFLNLLVEELGEPIHLILLSREQPSFDLQGLKVKQQADILTNEDLAFSLEECKDFFWEIRGLRFGSRSLKRIHQFTEGWIGGFILLAEILEGMSENSREKYLREDMPDRFKAEVFRYFAEEIFAFQPISIQEFLVKTSILECMDAAFANDFMGFEGAEAILQELVRRGLFVHCAYEDARGWIFRYHQLFRSFLKSRLKGSFSERERQLMFLKAAVLHEERGELEESVKYYLQAQAYSSAASVIERIGMRLLKEGRGSDLARWLEPIPEDLIQRSAWLLFHLSMTRRFNRARENIHTLRRALSLFVEQGDLRGELLCLASLIEALVICGHDPVPIALFLDQAENLLQTSRVDLHPSERANAWLQLGFALTVRGSNPRKGFWACENAYMISRDTGDFFIQVHALVNGLQALCWLGEFGLAEKRCNRLEKLVKKHPNVGVQLLYHTARCELSLFTGDLERARELVQFTRDEAAAQGLTYLYPVTLLYDLVLKPHLGRYREAEETGNRLLSFSASIGNSFMGGLTLLHLGRNLYFEGEYRSAKELIRQSRELLSSDEARSEYHLGLVGILDSFISCHLREGEETEVDLQKALDYFVGLACFVAVDGHFATALIRWNRAKTEEAASHLEAGLKLAEEKGYDHFMLTRPHDLLEICILALQLEVYGAIDYAAHLLTTRLAPLARPELKRLDDHPSQRIREKAWEISLAIHRSMLPHLRIETLGGFRVFRGGSLMRREDWLGSQPKNLMKAIVSHEPDGVPKEVLIDTLWPESRPEAAEKTFKASLYRLRRSLEPDMDKVFGYSYVHLKDNRVYLDRELCEVDVHEFLSLLERGGRRETEGDLKGALSCYKKAIEFYKGVFLPEDLYAGWLEPVRQELKGKYVMTLMRVAQIYEDRGALSRASSFCRKAIEADPYLEPAYQRLMVIFSQLGKRNEALKVYERCKRALKEGLDTEPDELTQSLHSKILE